MQGMQAAAAQRLIALNKEFYQTHAANFSATRGRLQPGVLRALAALPPAAQVLDLGCGNGGLAAEFARRGLQGEYVGVDFSQELLAVAEERAGEVKAKGLRLSFIQADLTSGNWAKGASLSNLDFDFIFAFAIMHHIPSRELRLAFLQQASELLAPSGRFVHSNWQFTRSPKLAARIQPWSAAGLEAAAVDPGDHLLDWRAGGQVGQEHALRYVHEFSEAELGELAAAAGFDVQETFYSDGKPGDLSLYSTWVKA
jgi:SAM-dependent methyltransferase